MSSIKILVNTCADGLLYISMDSSGDAVPETTPSNSWIRADLAEVRTIRLRRVKIHFNIDSIHIMIHG